MRKRNISAVAALVIGCVAPVLAEKTYILEASSDQVTRIAAEHGLRVIRPLLTTPSTFILGAPDSTPDSQLLKDVRSDSAVAVFEADATSSLPEVQAKKITMASVLGALQSLSIPGTTSFFGATVRTAYLQQPAASLVRWLDCQQMGWTGAGTIAVIDTGADPDHPAIRDSLVPGYDFVNNVPGVPTDLYAISAPAAAALTQSTVAILDKRMIAMLNQSTVAILDQSTVAILDGKVPESFGHGTMIAGLIHVVAPTAQIMPLRVFQDDGTTRLSDIVRAIYYAVDHGAQVINMSFSMPDSSQELLQAINYANSRKVICVASAGNDGREVLVYPAGYRQVFGVGSTSLVDKRSPFSNYGDSSVRAAAPGEALVTTYPGNNYAAVWGTSFSAALTSGAIALMQQAGGRVEFGKLADALAHGKKLDIELGDARLDAYQSVTYLKYSH